MMQSTLSRIKYRSPAWSFQIIPSHFSHWNAAKSLSDWLQEHNVPGIYGIDTRKLTQDDPRKRRHAGEDHR